MNRLGQDVSVDLKIGYLHAYPNGEIQFENSICKGDEEKNKSRIIKDRSINDSGLDELTKIMLGE